MEGCWALPNPNRKINTMTELPNRQVEVSNDDNKEIINEQFTEVGPRQCSSCGKVYNYKVPTKGYYEWVVLRYPIQKAFPDIDVDTKESLLMRTCIPCTKAIWDNLTGEDD